MKSIRKFWISISAAVLMLGAAVLMAPAVAAARTISGELVVLDGTADRFRIVDVAGSFRAPSGYRLEELDGKPVIVELAGDGRVLQITEKPIHIDPLTYHYEIVSGQLVLTDMATRTFTIAGDSRTYVAPPGVNLEANAGRMVEVLLDERGRVTDVRPSSRSDLGGPAIATTGVCSYNGRGFSDGASLCQSGTQFRCERGAWRSLGIGCTDVVSAPACEIGGFAYTHGMTYCRDGRQLICEHGQWRGLDAACASDMTVARAQPACILGGASLAHGVSICRSGQSYRCNAGEWVRIGTECR